MMKSIYINLINRRRAMNGQRLIPTIDLTEDEEPIDLTHSDDEQLDAEDKRKHRKSTVVADRQSTNRYKIWIARAFKFSLWTIVGLGAIGGFDKICSIYNHLFNGEAEEYMEVKVIRRF